MSLLAAEIDDVPDDQEVAGEIELLDQIQLALDLPRVARSSIRPVALARAGLRDLAQERRHRLARRHRVFRKAVAEIGHRVVEPLGQLAGGGERLRQIGEQPRHLRRRLEIALGVAGQPPPRLRQRGLVADAGEDVVERAIGRLGEADAVGGEDRHVERRREIAQRLVVRLLVAQQVPLQLEVDAGAPEDADQPIDQPADAEPRAAQHRRARRARSAPRRGRRARRGSAPLRPSAPAACHREQPAEIAIALRDSIRTGRRKTRVRGRGSRADARVAGRDLERSRSTASRSSAPPR